MTGRTGPPILRLVRWATMALGAAVVLLASACSGQHGIASLACGHTSVRHGSMPDWVAAYGVPRDSPYVLSSGGSAAGVLFADVLRAPAPSTGQRNKILWVVQPPLQAGFTIAAHPLDEASPLVHVFRASPGQVGQYPSYDDVPRAGCWRFVLSSGAADEFVDLRFSP